jgi:hypothetical protein
MWLSIKTVIFAHLVQSIVVASVVVVGVAGVSYWAIQQGNLSDTTKNSTAGTCSETVKVGTITVEKDPAGDPEAWLRFDYTASTTLDCQYTITFIDNQENVIRTIPGVEDTFQSPSGQIYNGYSSTPYQAGMTARVTLD